MPDTDAGQDDVTQDENAQAPPADFAAWMAALPEEARAQIAPLYEADTKGLKLALESERGIRKDLEKALKEEAGKAAKGSDAEKALLAMEQSASAADLRAEFYLAAQLAGVNNLKLAFIVATQEGLFDKRGNVNFVELQKDFPQLFNVAKPGIAPGNAGAGTGTGTPAGLSMNDIIRRDARR